MMCPECQRLMQPDGACGQLASVGQALLIDAKLCFEQFIHLQAQPVCVRGCNGRVYVALGSLEVRKICGQSRCMLPMVHCSASVLGSALPSTDGSMDTDLGRCRDTTARMAGFEALNVRVYHGSRR
jgi:hypothetical protein